MVKQITLYPKIYVTFAERRAKEWHHEYNDRDYEFVFRICRGPDEGGLMVFARYPTQSGKTPMHVKSTFWAARKANPKMESYKCYSLVSGTIVLKLYKRAGSWYFRHMGK